MSYRVPHPRPLRRIFQRGSAAVGVIAVTGTTAFVGAAYLGYHDTSTGGAIKKLVPEWQVKEPNLPGGHNPPDPEPGPEEECTYRKPANYPGPGSNLSLPAEEDACAKVVEAMCSDTCSNAADGFGMVGIEGGYQGRLRFLGCVPSSDGTCRTYIQGVGADHPMTDACGTPEPGCYFALSPPQEGLAGQYKDFQDACQTAENYGSLQLTDPKDKGCLDAMVGAGGGPDLACHSWATAFCSQNGLTDAEYYGGLCPQGAECTHNEGDLVPCAIYNCWLSGSGIGDAVWDYFDNYDDNESWNDPPGGTYLPPDRDMCDPDGPGDVFSAGERHSFDEYIRDRNDNDTGPDDGWNETRRDQPSACIQREDCQPTAIAKDQKERFKAWREENGTGDRITDYAVFWCQGTTPCTPQVGDQNRQRDAAAVLAGRGCNGPGPQPL